MPTSLSFIHAADLHFGAPFRGVRSLSHEWAHKLSCAIPEAFNTVIDSCIQKQVDFLLLSGDIFDSEVPSFAHYRAFLNSLKKLEAYDIAVYMVAGNHDPYATWKHRLVDLPSNVRLFRSDSAEYHIHYRQGVPIALIAARGFYNIATNEDIALGITRSVAIDTCSSIDPRCVEVSYVIGMLHTGAWLDPVKAPTSEKTLMSAGMDYWALGHIHTRQSIPSHDPVIVYSGNIQGRDVKEIGDRGVMYVRFEGDHKCLEFLPTADIIWEHITCDCTSCETVNDLITMCVRAAFVANAPYSCEQMIFRLTLTGTCVLACELCNDEVCDQIRKEINENLPCFYCTVIHNETRPFTPSGSTAATSEFFHMMKKRASFYKEYPQALQELLQQEFQEYKLYLPQNVSQHHDRLLEHALMRVELALDDQK